MKKEMITVKKFLCCLKLETGGYTIGWLTFISSILGAILVVAAIIGIAVVGCEDTFKAFDIELKENKENFCFYIFAVLYLALIYLLTYLIICAYISLLLIKGTKNRNHSRILPYMILLIVDFTISFLFLILLFKLQGALIALVQGLFYFYFYVCLYSLYKMFKEEPERELNEQNQTLNDNRAQA